MHACKLYKSISIIIVPEIQVNCKLSTVYKYQDINDRIHTMTQGRYTHMQMRNLQVWTLYIHMQSLLLQCSFDFYPIGLPRACMYMSQT